MLIVMVGDKGNFRAAENKIYLLYLLELFNRCGAGFGADSSPEVFRYVMSVLDVTAFRIFL